MSAIQPRSSKQLPQELLSYIFTFLDFHSLQACSLTSKHFLRLVDQRLWKEISLRDYLPLLCQLPLQPQELSLPKKESEIQVANEYFPEAEQAIEDLMGEKYIETEEVLTKVNDWKIFYSEKHEAIDLNGFWMGDYGKHGLELVRIYQKGYHVIAKKVTGDVNIPAGKLTWKMQLDESLMRGKGVLQVAEANYQSPKLMQAYLEVVNKDVLKITWLFQDYFGHWHTVTFTNTRASCATFDPKTMGRKVNLLKLEKQEKEVDE